MRPLRRPNFFDRLSVVADCVSYLVLNPACSWLRCRRGFVPSTRLGFVHEVAHFPRCPDKDVVGPPMFPDDPPVRLPGSQTPAGPDTLPMPVLRCCPCYSDSTSSCVDCVSWLNSRAFALTVYASCRSSLAATQDSLLVVANLSRWDLLTHRVVMSSFGFRRPCSRAFMAPQSLQTLMRRTLTIHTDRDVHGKTPLNSSTRQRHWYD